MSRYPLLCLIVFSLGLVACRSKGSDPKPGSVEPGISGISSVVFNIVPASGANGTTILDATYSSQGKQAKFRIHLGTPSSPSDLGTMKIQFGKGWFEAFPSSDASALVSDLKKALGAKRLPTDVKRTKELPFSYAILGANQSLREGGGFADRPAGNWTAMKIFLTSPNGDDDKEVFLNFSLKERIGEFTEKDPDHGDAVVALLATVL